MLAKRNPLSLLGRHISALDPWSGFNELANWLEEPVFASNDPVRFTTDEDTSKYYIRGVIPGYTEKDVKLTLTGDQLVLTGHKETVDEQKDRFSSTTSSFRQVYYLRKDAVKDEVDAEIKNGILVVSIPRREPKLLGEEKVIPIKATES